MINWMQRSQGVKLKNTVSCNDCDNFDAALPYQISSHIKKALWESQSVLPSQRFSHFFCHFLICIDLLSLSPYCTFHKERVHVRSPSRTPSTFNNVWSLSKYLLTILWICNTLRSKEINKHINKWKSQKLRPAVCLPQGIQLGNGRGRIWTQVCVDFQACALTCYFI